MKTYLGPHYSTHKLSGNKINREVEKIVDVELFRIFKVKNNPEELQKGIVIIEIEYIGNK